MSRPHLSKPGRIHRIWPVLRTLCGYVAAGLIVAMMCLTGTDVVARYFFNAPVKGAFELTEIMLAALVFVAMPITTGSRAHIEVELFNPRSEMLGKVMSAFGTLCGVVVFAVLSYEIWLHASRLAKYGQVSNSLEIPLSLIAYLVSGCCALCLVVLIIPRQPER